MKIFIYILKLLFSSKYKPCPYWNFFTRTCMAGGHTLGFENKEYCKYHDIIGCLHYH